MKKCYVCGGEDFNSRGSCRECRRVYSRAYRTANLDACLARARAWRNNNPDRKKEYSQSYYLANRKALIASSKAYARDNPDRVRATRLKHLTANRKIIAAQYAAWYAANQEKNRRKTASYRANNMPRILARNQNRRAALRSGGRLSLNIISKLLALQHGLCVACHALLADAGYHIDHVIALTAGGKNIDTNVQLLCPSCNTSKGTKHPVDFMQRKGFLL